MSSRWHLRANKRIGDVDWTVSLDFEKHMFALPQQRDVLEELLEQPEPTLPEAAVRTRHTLLTDALIFKYVEVHGPKWRKLSRSLGGRNYGYSDDVVRNRYVRMMNALGRPYVSRLTRKRPPRRPACRSELWKPSEDAAIAHALAEQPRASWSKVAAALDGARTTQAVRNRANRLHLQSRYQCVAEEAQRRATHAEEDSLPEEPLEVMDGGSGEEGVEQWQANVNHANDGNKMNPELAAQPRLL